MTLRSVELTRGYGFAYAAWIRRSASRCENASKGLHYYTAFYWMQEGARRG
jgi:hypothetical protein